MTVVPLPEPTEEGLIACITKGMQEVPQKAQKVLILPPQPVRIAWFRRHFFRAEAFVRNMGSEKWNNALDYFSDPIFLTENFVLGVKKIR